MLKVKWPDFTAVLREGPYINWIDLGNGTMLRLAAFFTYNILNSPKDGLFISIERVGSYLFDLRTWVSGEYVSGKLGMCLADANNLADWINTQINHEWKQQGHYDRIYIDAVEPYGLIGEAWHMPLYPCVIEENEDGA